MENKVVCVERVFNAPRSLVWRALTEKELMKSWYFDLAEFEARVGFTFEFEGGTEENKYLHLCEVSEVIVEQKLSYTWKYKGYEGVSLVSFELFSEDNATRLKLTHTGIGSFPPIPDFAIHNFEQGWNQIINTSLTEFLSKHKQ